MVMNENSKDLRLSLKDMYSALSLFLLCMGMCISLEISAAQTAEACFMGAYKNRTCVCLDGWSGRFCDHCSGRVMVNHSTGFISDGPLRYKNSSTCSWLIQPWIRHTTLKLTLLEFGSECGWDYLYIYDGDSAFSPLLASYNGLLITSNSENNVPYPQLIAKSGVAFLQFFSDAAYTLSGFNISYSVDECLYNCSGNGFCSGGICLCNEGWTGDSCNYQINCINPSCDNIEKVWSVFPVEPDISARASYGAASCGDSMWIYGGISLNGSPNELAMYNATTDNWTVINNVKNSPTIRYSHTMVFAEGKLLVFGGILPENETAVDDLWEFNTNNISWTMIAYNNLIHSSGQGYSSLLLSGHSAHYLKASNGSNIMLVMFGYHPVEEYNSNIYKYNLDDKTWRKPSLIGAKVPGVYGHSSVYDNLSGKIFIHGGYCAEGLSADTFSYSPETNLVIKLMSSGIPRFLHSAVMLDRFMYIFGGNTHNDTNESTGAKCFSTELIAMDVACNSWNLIAGPKLHSVERFGHKALVLTVNKTVEKMFVFSGFNGRMISDLLVYCPNITMEKAYKDSIATSSKNIWKNGTGNSPMPKNKLHLLCTNSQKKLEQSCNVLSDEGCDHCLASFNGCAYCKETLTCHYHLNSQPCTLPCSESQNKYCSTFPNCFQCKSASSSCEWHKNVCVAGEQTTEVCNINSTCTNQLTCTECAKRSSCMWCLNMQKCIPTNSYVIQFPYGQCFQWINTESTCHEYNCSLLRTCKTCQNVRKCGWCDDGSETGTGSCMEGGGSGPLRYGSHVNVTNKNMCPKNRWHFSTCPSCQCNGHSKCSEGGVCVACKNNTNGVQCERCMVGFFGDATNGGTCQQCECNKKALVCDDVSGTCLCFTKGVNGHSCEQCDYNAGYTGNASGNGTCFYKLTENYQFKFSFNLVADRFVSRINFQNSPKAQDDVVMTLESLKPVSIAIQLSVVNLLQNQILLVAKNITSLHETFSGSELNFGTSSNATIYILVADISVPSWIKVSLTQRSNRLLHILLILFSSFLVVLFGAALAWKLKLMYEAYHLRETRAVELEQMAARPFAGINFICNETMVDFGICNVSKESGAVICKENCSNAALCVTTTLLCMPNHFQDCQKNHKYFGLEVCLGPQFGHSMFVFGSTLTTS